MQHDYSFKKLNFSHRAQTITHFAVRFSGYVSNMAEKWQENKYCFALNISVYIIIIH